jgi:hypothetical protein
MGDGPEAEGDAPDQKGQLLRLVGHVISFGVDRLGSLAQRAPLVARASRLAVPSFVRPCPRWRRA